MRVDAARIDGGKLILSLPSPGEAARLVYSFEPGEYAIEKRSHRKRSLDANGYCWVLCERIAQAVGMRKEEVYRQSILNVGAFFRAFVMPEDYDGFCREWQGHGIGWLVQKVDDSCLPYELFCYYGSSVYDTAQMSRLIDDLVQEAQSIGIETMNEEELRSLLEAWNGK